MALSNLSEEENVLFYKKLQLRYEEEYKTMKQFVAFSKLSTTGISLIPKGKTKEVVKYPFSSIDSNQLVYYSKNRKNDVFYLLKHLRNSIAHNRINRMKINDIIHYKFEDKMKLDGTYCHTLKGYIKQNDWERFVDFIYNESKSI